jgi:hypothetical protein
MFVAALLVMLLLGPLVAYADQESAAGASDTEIRIGNIMPYTGPFAAFATIEKAEAACFDMINDNGGINGRKIKFISYDDNSKPATAVELTRQLETSIGAGEGRRRVLATLNANVQDRSNWDQKNVGVTRTIRSTNSSEKGCGIIFGTLLASSKEAPQIRSLGGER